MKCSDQIDKIAPAFAAAQAEFPKVGKAGRAKVVAKSGASFEYEYALMPDVQDALLPVLGRHGIAVTQGTADEDESGFTIETTLLHTSGQWISQRVRVPIAQHTAQAAGSAFAYGRRIGLVGTTGLITDEPDDDGALASDLPAPDQRPMSKGGGIPPAPQAPRQSAPAPRPAGSVPVLPFGKTKGTPLAKMKTEDILSAQAWAMDKGKFQEFVQEANAELARREAAEPTDKYTGAPDMSKPPEVFDNSDDDLPW